MAYNDSGYRSPSVGAYEQRTSNDDFSGPDPRRHSGYMTPYPSQYTGDRVNMPEPRAASPHPPSSYQTPHGYQPYGGPDGYEYQQQGGINDAIHSAFYKTNPSNYLSPEVLNQITDQVIQQLKSTGLYNTQEQQQQSIQSPGQQPAAHAPPTELDASTSDGKRSVNNAPSPHRSPEIREQQSPPPQIKYPPPPEKKESPSSQASDHAQKESRPKALSRTPTAEELTTLEKIWGKLFEDGKPTKRLGQFLRGIAVHLIEEYPPGNTLVVLPYKLQKFYQDTKVPLDPYPWQDIFDDNTSSISRLYRAIEAEHHLVQEKLDERPDIPGLTPRGFERWASLMIQAHPQREFERLQKAVLAMPISNPDNRKERFPKEIPRRLFPEVPDLAVREKLDKAITTHCGVHLPPITEEERSKAASHRRTASKEKTPAGSASTTTEPIHSHTERERPPQTAQTSAVIDDEEEAAPARPIERERKPYIAQPGGGKIYDDSSSPRHSHTNSFSSGVRPKEYVFAPTSAPGQKPSGHHNLDPTHTHTGVDAGGLYPPTTRHGRGRSPSFGAGVSSYRHSESDLFSNNAGHNGNGPYSASNTSTFPDDVFEDGHTRRYHYDRSSEDGRTYETLRDRERDQGRENPRYHAYPVHGNWSTDEDYYRGMLGGQGNGPVDGSTYKTYTYR